MLSPHAGFATSAENPTALSATPAPNLADERTLESRELLGGGREVRIRHGADFYRLRLTQNGKLILQK